MSYELTRGGMGTTGIDKTSTTPNTTTGEGLPLPFQCRTTAPFTFYERVRQAQVHLLAVGHSPGAIDGKLGPNTARAIRQYAQAQGATTVRSRLDTAVYDCAMTFPVQTGAGSGGGTQPSGDTPGSVFDTAASWDATLRAYATNPITWLVVGAGATGVLLLREAYKKHPRRLKGQIRHERLKRPIPRTQVKHGRGFRELEERL